MTSEEYVVKKLLSLEEENGKLKNNLEAVNKAFEKVNSKFLSLMEMLRKHAKYKTSSLNTYYIDFDTFWNRSYSQDEKADFEFMRNLLGVDDEEFEPYVAPVIEEEKENEDGAEE